MGSVATVPNREVLSVLQRFRAFAQCLKALHVLLHAIELCPKGSARGIDREDGGARIRSAGVSIRI